MTPLIYFGSMLGILLMGVWMGYTVHGAKPTTVSEAARILGRRRRA